MPTGPARIAQSIARSDLPWQWGYMYMDRVASFYLLARYVFSLCSLEPKIVHQTFKIFDCSISKGYPPDKDIKL